MGTRKDIIDRADDGDRYADPLDVATNRTQQEIDHRISEARIKCEEQERAAIEAFTGHCLFCDEDVPKGHRWCDSICRDDYEARIKAQDRSNRGY